MSRLGHSVLVAIYNPLGWPRTEGVRVPISTNFSANWTVTGFALPCLLLTRELFHQVSMTIR